MLLSLQWAIVDSRGRAVQVPGGAGWQPVRFCIRYVLRTAHASLAIVPRRDGGNPSLETRLPAREEAACFFVYLVRMAYSITRLYTFSCRTSHPSPSLPPPSLGTRKTSTCPPHHRRVRNTPSFNIQAPNEGSSRLCHCPRAENKRYLSLLGIGALERNQGDTRGLVSRRSGGNRTGLLVL